MFVGSLRAPNSNIRVRGEGGAGTINPPTVDSASANYAPHTTVVALKLVHCHFSLVGPVFFKSP